MRLGGLLAATLLATAGLVVPGSQVAHAEPDPPRRSADAPTISLSWRQDPALPHVVSDSPRTLTLKVRTTGLVEGVTLRFRGPGIHVLQAPDFTDTTVVRLGRVRGYRQVRLLVRGTGRGFHPLTVTATGKDAAAATTEQPLLWTGPDKSAVTATGDLSGRFYAWRVNYLEYQIGRLHTDYLLSFIDGHRVYIGSPRRGAPSCRRPRLLPIGCSTYSYDAVTGLVRIGGTVGRVLGDDLFVSGIGRGHFPGSVSERVLKRRWAYAEPGLLDGRWRDVQQGRSTHVTDLTLRADGTFSLVDGDEPDPAPIVGTYGVPKAGRLVLRVAGSDVVRTLAVRVGSDGEARPDLGVWLTQPRPEPHFPQEITYLAPVAD